MPPLDPLFSPMEFCFFRPESLGGGCPGFNSPISWGRYNKLKKLSYPTEMKFFFCWKIFFFFLKSNLKIFFLAPGKWQNRNKGVCGREKFLPIFSPNSQICKWNTEISKICQKKIKWGIFGLLGGGNRKKFFSWGFLEQRNNKCN